VATVGVEIIVFVCGPFDHVYVLAPVAVKLAVVEKQTDAEAEVMLMVGLGLAITANVLLVAQPTEFVPVAV
jgi:hypothetical protein